MAKYLRDVQGIATISGKIAAKLGPASSTGEFNVSQYSKGTRPDQFVPGYFEFDWFRGTPNITSSN